MPRRWRNKSGFYPRALVPVCACVKERVNDGEGVAPYRKQATMASRSLTAVTSFVSVMKEKTVVVLKLNVKGCQRVGLPIAIIVACFLTAGLLVAAAATDRMILVGSVNIAVHIVLYSHNMKTFIVVENLLYCVRLHSRILYHR